MDVTTLPPPAAPTSPAQDPAAPKGFKRKRNWTTTHVILVALAALLLGMKLGYEPKKSAGASTSGVDGGGLPPQPGSGSATTTTAPPAEGESDTTESTSPSQGTDVDGDPLPGDAQEPESSDANESTGTTVPASGSATPATAKMLLDVPPRTGGITTQGFTVAAGGWQMGWGFNCASQGGSGTFKITAQRPDGSPVENFPGIDQSGPGATGVEDFTSEGAHTLVVTTNCRWAIKITGVPG